MSDRPIALDGWLNAVAATWDEDRKAGFVNAWGNSFPAEELPFGTALRRGGRVFRLAAKTPGAADHLEVLGQRLAAPGAPLVSGVAALCFAEMGPRDWSLRASGPDGAEDVGFIAPGWLVAPGAADPAEHLVASHLHYVGGYELDRLVPVTWRVEAAFRRPRRVAELQLSESPLVHLLALSLREVAP